MAPVYRASDGYYAIFEAAHRAAVLGYDAKRFSSCFVHFHLQTVFCRHMHKNIIHLRNIHCVSVFFSYSMQQQLASFPFESTKP